jgi:hypothetical protein
MIKYISDFSSLNFVEDWQMDFDQAECYAQPFTTDDIIKIHALSTVGDGETAYLKVANVDTGQEKEVSCQNTGIRSGEYWIVEYNFTGLNLIEGVYEVYMMDKIDGDDYYVRDFNHNGASSILFKIISAEAAKETVKLVYTDRENNFDTAFNDEETVYEEIENNDRWGTNLIMGGAHYAIPVSVLNYVPIITPNVTNDVANLLGWSHDVVKNNVFIGGNYYEQELANGVAFIVQYDEVRFYDHNNDEIIYPDGTLVGVMTLSASYRAGGQDFDDSAESDMIIGSNSLCPLFIPPVKTISGVDYPVTYTDKYGADASGWFFGLSMVLGGGTVPEGTKVVFTNLLIAPITAAEYNDLHPGELLAWSKALEEVSPESIYFDFRVEGGFLPSERTFAADSGDFRDQRYTPTQLSARPYQKKTLCIGNRKGVPYWVGKKINLIFSCSFVEVNGVEHVRSQNSEPEVNPIADLYPLIAYKIELEEKENYKTAMKYVKIPQDTIVVDKITRILLTVDNSSANFLADTAESEGFVYIMQKLLSSTPFIPYLLNYMARDVPEGFKVIPVPGGFGIESVTSRIVKFNGKYYFAGIENQGDSVAMWETVDFISKVKKPMPPNSTVRSFFQFNGYVFFQTEYGIYRTQTFDSWELVLSASYIMNACSAGDMIFAGGHLGRLMYSADNGDTWVQGQQLETGSGVVLSTSDAIRVNGEYFMTSGTPYQTFSGLYRSSDGIDWEKIKKNDYSWGFMAAVYDTENLYLFGNGPIAFKTGNFTNYEDIAMSFNNSNAWIYHNGKLFDGKNWVIWSARGRLTVLEGKVVIKE